MQLTRLAGKLGRSDFKILGRERLPIFMFLFVVYIVTVLRWGLPWLNTYLTEKGIMPSDLIPMPLSAHYPMIIAYLALFTGALIMGTVIGFTLLDEKEQNTLKAMMVTPVPLQQYLRYRIGLTMMIGYVIVVGMALFINQALVPLWQLLILAAGASLSAPIATLFFAAFAENKVQAFAYGKFVGIAGWFILLGWFVPEPWQWLFGLFPPFWISKAYWLALEGNEAWWIALIVGVVLQLGLIRWLMERFNKAAHR